MCIENIPDTDMRYFGTVMIALWIVMALASVLAIACDMRRLAANQVGLPLWVWIAAVLAIGVFALPIYLRLRVGACRRLMAAAWTMAGDERTDPSLRRRRLEALRQVGLIGKPIYRACLKQLEEK